jgi:RNA polymerase sigma factor (sigma-70 family)
MYPRDRLIDLFSTFAILDDDRFRQWVSDPKLQRNMQRHLTDTSKPDTTDKVWAIYWHQNRAKHPLAQIHLAAYLQEPCFWVAREMTQRHKAPQYTLADYFQLANSEIPRVLKSFTADGGSSLKTYGKLVLSNALKDLLRQRQAADVCSDWSLLRKTSKKRIGEVLLHRGVIEPDAVQSQLAWFCFKTLYIPPESNGKQLHPPDALCWQAIAELYNTQRLSQLVTPGNAITPAQVEVRLNKLAKWCREYLYPSIDSINNSKPEPGTGEVQDDLTDDGMSLLDDAIEREEIEARVKQQSQLQTILTQSLAALGVDLQTILQLRYQDDLSQVELADRLGVSQPTVYRRIREAESTLLTALLQWVELQLNKFPDPNEVKVISRTLKEWLTEHYSISTIDR